MSNRAISARQRKLVGNSTSLVRVLPHWITTQSQSVSFDGPEARLCSARRFRRSTSSSAHAPDAPVGLLVVIVNVEVAAVDEETNWVGGGADEGVAGGAGVDWAGIVG
jgi:hypothetical protein